MTEAMPIRPTACTALVLALMLPSGAQAKSHLWDILTLYSNEAGNIQFIDLFISDPAGTSEYFFAGKEISSNTNTYLFPNDLPQNKSTFRTWVLIATQDYADLHGAPTPDFIIPANFFDPTGDEIRYRINADIVIIPPGVMPTDGILMLNRDLTTSLNLGINFAGEAVTVNGPPGHPIAVPGLGGWGAALATLLSVALGALVLRGRRRNVRTN